MDALVDVLVAVIVMCVYGALAGLVALGAVAMFATAYTWLTGRELLP